MTSRLSRAELVVKLAKRKEDQASMLLQQWRERVEAQRCQLDDLKTYQESYHKRGIKQGSVQALITERAFLTQLAEVLVEQEQRLNQLEYQYQLYTEHWQKLYRRRQLLEEHRGRVAFETSQALDRQWDKLCEELVINAHFTTGQRST